MVKTTNDINNMLKDEMEAVMNMEYSLETEQFIVDMFDKINKKINPQTLELQDIKFIKPALKLDYLIDGKQFTMICDVKRD